MLHSSPNKTPLLPLGALAAGFGLLGSGSLAQTTATKPETTMQPIAVKAQAETDANSVRALTTKIGKTEQEMRDVPQSMTVLTEKLIEERRVDTLKEALHLTGGITFQAAEGGEEDVRLRGFSLATSGDIYVDALRDPAFYERDTFSVERIELLRGPASMLFGRGSTGGVVNQVHKQAFLDNANEVTFTGGTGGFLRLTGDFNYKLGEASAMRVNVMRNSADNYGNFIDKRGLAVNLRWGIDTDDEFSAAGYLLKNHNGIHYGLPWLRSSSTQTSADPSSIIEGLDPRKSYFQAASDYNDGSANYGTFSWTHRLRDGARVQTVLRQGYFDRDQRAGTIRFCVAPTCAGFTTPGLNGPVFVTDATPLTRGTNNKVQNLHTTYLQSVYSRNADWGGRRHELLAGIDAAHEVFAGYATVLPAGVTLDKNSPRTTIGTPNDGTGWVDESLRLKLQQSGFDSKSIGVYAQDLVEVAPSWKLLAGLRRDYVRGSYQTYQTSSAGTNPPPIGTVTADRARSDGLWSPRLGVLYQPADNRSFYFSYGTSYNTSGDTYMYDAPGSNTPPEKSRNIELGAYLDLFDGNLSTRVSAFRAEKTNERNRDSPAGTPLVDYLLSGKRHTAGIDLDLAGRINAQWTVFVSYTWLPIASIDAGNADGTTQTAERVGERPSMTPRHSGSVWTTYRLTPAWRLGGGFNGRSSQTPNRNPAGIVAPSWLSADLMAEYEVNPQWLVRLNATNVTNKTYADALYTGHYIPGAPRSVQLSVSGRF